MNTEQRLYIDNLPTKPADVLTIDTNALQWEPESYRASAERWIGRARVDRDNANEYAQIARAMNRAYITARREEPPAPKVQVTKDGPAYLLPGVDPAPRKRGDADQLTMF